MRSLWSFPFRLPNSHSSSLSLNIVPISKKFLCSVSFSQECEERTDKCVCGWTTWKHNATGCHWSGGIKSPHLHRKWVKVPLDPCCALEEVCIALPQKVKQREVSWFKGSLQPRHGLLVKGRMSDTTLCSCFNSLTLKATRPSSWKTHYALNRGGFVHHTNTHSFPHIRALYSDPSVSVVLFSCRRRLTFVDIHHI